jgi:NAD(P)-dependent dehydrogenase (short-subunit alcohol dehydrogenase family)
MELELKGRVAVVTGTSVGIGREIAKVLAAEGVQTVVTARRATLLATLQEEIERAGARARSRCPSISTKPRPPRGFATPRFPPTGTSTS